ncbi:FAD-binding oxidoreductase [Chitinispirillales bacterium ANBcel5]|uniref:FAD-binding oxidoreductase n=1 Tax=Cellulosispirillum alkaliphilum TaxID=3039283 RepID=UPI002A53AF7D|nr:FAD-binding oxidoreductase [Chitinispirillales bacterium ANBcel5]
MKITEGKERILKHYPDLLSDESKYTDGVPSKICFPESAKDISNILKEAFKTSTPVTLSGARTGVTGGASPIDDSVLISFSKMNRILSCDWIDENTPVLYCEPGVTLKEIDDFLLNPRSWPSKVKGSENLAPGRFFYPPDPTESSAQLGGTVATNASGARSYYYGPTRSYIESLQVVVFPDQTIDLKRNSPNNESNTINYFNFLNDASFKDLTSPCIKNASGYYLHKDMEPLDLFIGSEGTLGVISKIGIKLTKRVDLTGGLTFFPCNDTAFDFADYLRTIKFVTAIEYFDSSALRLFSTPYKPSNLTVPQFPEKMNCAIYWEYIENDEAPFESIFEKWEQILKQCKSSFELTWSGFDPQEMKRLKEFRHAVPELVNMVVNYNQQKDPGIRKFSTDSSIPHSKFRLWFKECVELLKKEPIQYAAFGHLGDYHLHINILPQSSKELKRSEALYHKFMKSACLAGGTISAEHGVGKLKKSYLKYMYGLDSINTMKAIKQKFDPQSLLNRGVLFE